MKTHLTGEVRIENGVATPAPRWWKLFLGTVSFGWIRLPAVIRGDIHSNDCQLRIGQADNVTLIGNIYGPTT